jgi:sterol desaturase/sphingolipid hydroxylase (fatty acid hydroxylase superfamily)
MVDLLHAAMRALELAVGWIFSAQWLPPKDFQFLRWLIVPGYGYGLVLILFAVLELVIPYQRRPWNRLSFLSGTYVAMAGKMNLYVLLVAPSIRKGWILFGLPSLHLDRSLPLALYMPVALLAATFVAYWAHRGMHRIPLLWHFHKIHHSAQNLNWSSIYHRHLLEELLHVPFNTVAILALGTDLVAPFGIIFMTIDVLGHSNIRLDLGRLSYFISTPQAHRVHHSTDARHYDTNFGNTFMLWDHLFGTFCYDPEHPPTAYGINEAIPPSFLKQQALPFTWVARTAGAGFSRLVARGRASA